MQKLDFEISTGLKSIIGKELITEEHTAIFELVKNSYDANSPKVTIIFEKVTGNSPEKDSKLIIIDYGKGMSYSDIKDKWLFVGYSEKKIEDEDDSDFRDKISNRKRVFAGAKGIGKKKKKKKGPRLNLYTKKANEDKVHFLEMDWEKFEKDQNKEFQTVKVDYTSLEKFPDKLHFDESEKQGTVLEIFPLRDNWDRIRLLKLKRYLQRLVNPVKIPDNEKFEIEIIAEEFLKDDEKLKKKNKNVNGLVTNIIFEKLNINSTQIICTIKKTKIITEVIDKGNFVFRIEEKNTFSPLKDIDIHIFYLNREAKKEFTRTMGIRPIQFFFIGIALGFIHMAKRMMTG